MSRGTSHWRAKSYNNKQHTNTNYGYHSDKKRNNNTNNKYQNRRSHNRVNINHNQKNYHSQQNYATNNNHRNAASWIPRTDIRLEKIKEFVAFFNAKYHQKQEIENAYIYIKRLLTKLNKDDVSILLNHTNKKALIGNLRSKSPNIYNFYQSKSFPNSFSPISHCIFNIGNSWKYDYMNCQYQVFVINEWVKIIKLLLKNNANPFQCIYCSTDLNIYDQHCYCIDRPKSALLLYPNGQQSKKHQYMPTRRDMYKLHSTPFKHLFLFCRHDLHQMVVNKKIEKHDEFWWMKKEKILNETEKIKYSNVHKAVFEILQFILNEYDEILPLIRLEFKKIHFGTPGYCDYEWKLIPFHVSLPVFPSYDILYNLLSIERVVPFKFVNHSKYCSKEIDDNKSEQFEPMNEKFLLTSDFGINLWNDRNIYQFVTNYPEKAFEIAKKYSTKTLANYKNYNEYEAEFGFGSFYEELCQYLAFAEPDLVQELCQFARYDHDMDEFKVKYRMRKKESRIKECIYDEMSYQDVARYLSEYDHNVDGMKNDFPMNWSIVLLFTMQQIQNIQKANAIWSVQPTLSENIIALILEWSYFNPYDEYFDGPQFLSNHDNIQKAIMLMEKYCIINDERKENDNNNNKYRKSFKNKEFVPFKHRTTNYVINSWKNAFKEIKFKHEFFKPILILNENKLDEIRKNKINEINKNKYITHYYINIGQENNKLDKLIDILPKFEGDKIIVVCEQNESVDKLRNDLNEQKDNTSLTFCILSYFTESIFKEQSADSYGLIANYESHKKNWKNNGFAILILYDLPLNIDEYISQIDGYSNIISLITNNEYKDQYIKFKEKYGLNMIPFPTIKNFENIISEKQQLIFKNDIKIYYISVEKEDYKLATFFDLFQSLHYNISGTVYCDSAIKVKWIKSKFKDRFPSHSNISNTWIITENIDFHGLSTDLIINYDFPQSRDDYFYRMSKCKKVVIDFVTDDEETKMREIKTFYNMTIDELPMDVQGLFN